MPHFNWSHNSQPTTIKNWHSNTHKRTHTHIVENSSEMIGSNMKLISGYTLAAATLLARVNGESGADRELVSTMPECSTFMSITCHAPASSKVLFTLLLLSLPTHMIFIYRAGCRRKCTPRRTSPLPRCSEEWCKRQRMWRFASLAYCCRVCRTWVRWKR